jgi:uncharacterized membrane protein YhhN
VTRSACQALAFVLYAIICVLYLGSQLAGAGGVQAFTKPLLMPLLLVGLVISLPTLRSGIALFASLGILFSWAGDVFLQTPGDAGFLVGLGCFALAHVAYLILFIRELRMRRLPWLALVYVPWWVALVVTLAPHLGALLVPVAVYGLLLGSVAAFGLACNRWIAVGTAVFLVSDTLLGLHMFLPGFDFPGVDFAIMLPYVVGQGFIAWGAIARAWAKTITRLGAADS